jgi:hypothetical protein
MSQQIASNTSEIPQPPHDRERLKALVGVSIIGFGGVATIAWSGFLLWALVEGIKQLF